MARVGTRGSKPPARGAARRTIGRSGKKDGAAQVLEGKEDLRTSMKKLSKGPMKFAFGFKDRKTPILLMHKTKSSRALHNELKTKMGAKTATHGLASADGTALVMDVEGPPIPSMDKMVKVLLRKEKIDKYKEARVRMSADVAAEAEADVKGEGAKDARAAALLARLQELQGEIQALEPIAAELLRRIAAGENVDRSPVSDYVRLCAGFGKSARGCGDAELLEFGKNRLGRAKKMSGLMERFAPPPKTAPADGAGDASVDQSAPPQEPAAPSADLSAPVGRGGRNVEADVTSVQGLLKDQGASIEVDGKCGPKTIAAIARFQKEKLNFADGRVDPGGKTWGALTGGAPAASPAGSPGAQEAPAAPGAGGAVDTAVGESGKGASGKSVPGGDEVEIGCDPTESDDETADEMTEQERADGYSEHMREYLHQKMASSGLDGDLRPFRSSAEYNAIVDAWHAETERVATGGKIHGEPKWVAMIDQLAATARKRKAVHDAVDDAEKEAEDAAAEQAVAAMEAARPRAQGPGNVLNNKLQKTLNDEAKKYFDKGWQSWNAAEQARTQALSLQGPAKVEKALEAKALYEQARATFQAGLQQ